MRCYLSFSDKDVFKGEALPEQTPIIPPKEVTPQSAQPTPASTPMKEAIMDTTMEPAEEKRPPNKFPGWEKLATSLQTCSYHQADSPFVNRPKTKAS